MSRSSARYRGHIFQIKAAMKEICVSQKHLVSLLKTLWIEEKNAHNKQFLFVVPYWRSRRGL